MDASDFLLQLLLVLLAARIFAELGRASGVFDNQVYAGLIIVIALTTLLPTFVLKWLYRREGAAAANT